MNYKILLREEPEGGFTVMVPSLEGCVTYGNDLAEAKKNAREAIQLYVESLKADGLPLPLEENLLELNLQVNHA